MNLAKAREYFSAYHEGTLDRGLKQQFEAHLNGDAQLQAEYRAFERTITQLETLKAEVPEPDFDLHDRISARLDRHALESREHAKPGWFSWVRGYAVAGLAAFAFIGFFASKQLGAFGAGSLVLGEPSISIVETVDGVKVTIPGEASERSLDVELVDGSSLESTEIGKGGYTQNLANRNETAQLLTLKIEGAAHAVKIALPGSKREVNKEGSGTVDQFAMAIADKHGVPVVLEGDGDFGVLTWTLESASPVDDVRQVLGPKSMIDQRSGVLWISSK